MPLGKLVIEKSYSTKKRKVKGTKTENPREMPVYPTLARILAEWKLAGFEQLTGRTLRPDDPIVPSRRGAYRERQRLRRFPTRRVARHRMRGRCRRRWSATGRHEERRRGGSQIDRLG